MIKNNDTEMGFEGHVQNRRPGDVPRISPCRRHFGTFLEHF